MAYKCYREVQQCLNITLKPFLHNLFSIMNKNWLTSEKIVAVMAMETSLKSFLYDTNNTNFCIHFVITLKSMRRQCHRQRKSLTMQLNSRPVGRVELCMKVSIQDCGEYRQFYLCEFLLKAAKPSFSPINLII